MSQLISQAEKPNPGQPYLSWADYVVGLSVWQEIGEGGARISPSVVAAKLSMSATQAANALARLVKMGAFTQIGGVRSASYVRANPVVPYRRSKGNAIVLVRLDDPIRAQSNIASFLEHRSQAQARARGPIVVRSG